MKIESKDWDISSLLAGKYFKIPRYQRPYSWERIHLEEFWQDTIQHRASGDDYFIGSLVVYKRDNIYSIVDGQQRLTTITIMLCVIRDAFQKEGFESLASGVHTLVERYNIAHELQYVLSTESSYPYFQEYIQKRTDPDIELTPGPEERALAAAQEFFQAEISSVLDTIKADESLDEKKRKAAIKKKLETIRDDLLELQCIFVELDDEDDAYLVFETLNTRGKDLRVSDLVKNHITRLKKPTTKHVDIARDKWSSILENFDESEARLSVDAYLHHFWLSRFDFAAQKNLFKAIKNQIKKAQIDDFVDNLVDDARLYRTIHETSFKSPKWTIQEAPVRETLDAMTLFGIRLSVPMVLAVIRDWQSGALKLRHVKSTLHALESFHFIFNAVTAQRATGGLSMMFAASAAQLFRAKPIDKLKVCKDLRAKIRQRLPKFEDFQLAFREIQFTQTQTKQKSLVRYILGKIAAHLGSPLDLSQLTIEHILPQSAAASGDVAGELGNLILVPEKLNSEKLANKSFAEKKASSPESVGEFWLG